MTGKEITDKALSLLGYTDNLGNVSGAERLQSRAISVINSIYSDLYYMNNTSGFTPITKLDDDIELPERVLNDVMPYGVAMLTAQSESDGAEQQLWSAIYNRKRVSLTTIGQISDVLPECDDI